MILGMLHVENIIRIKWHLRHGIASGLKDTDRIGVHAWHLRVFATNMQKSKGV